MKVKIGIDVGGTFTDGVVISDDDYKIIGKAKVFTTHSAKEGVTRGIIEVLKKLIKRYNINLDDIVFLAHSTTQATNALLEGDVQPVGILGVGMGLDGIKAKRDTNISNIELAPGKYIKTFHSFLENQQLSNNIIVTLQGLKKRGAQVIVAAEPYSVDTPDNENFIKEKANEIGLVATATHEISKLYGLKVRTRTSVINASILPKMIETAKMTVDSIQTFTIKAPLMIMRGDGGVMGINEMMKRPILTLLSGPAAGVAGALMYEKISDGIFLEVGGTSTDISVIKNGEVMVKSARISNHKTYVNSLDVNTVGIAGGSMVKINDKEIEDVGPRSAHIAGVPYEVFATEEEIEEPELITIQPIPGDSDKYAAVKCKNRKQYALTLTGAASVLKKIPERSYSYGNYKAAYKAFAPLARKMNQEVEEVAEAIMRKAINKIKKVILDFIDEYHLDVNIVELVGGGGGAGAIVPYLAEAMNLKYRLAKNEEVISTIGVALAMVREVVERTVADPSEQDVLKIRKEVEEAILKSGASEQSIEVKVEIDKEKNILRAIAVGATELKKRSLEAERLTNQKLKDIVAESIGVNVSKIRKLATSGELLVMGDENGKKKLWGPIYKKVTPLRVVTPYGVIKLKVNNGAVVTTKYAQLIAILEKELKKRTKYMDAGPEVPYVYIACGSRLLNLAGLVDEKQIISMTKIEFDGYSDSQPTFIVFVKRGE